jgi:outer membrane lipoprotein-sorting protein
MNRKLSIAVLLLLTSLLCALPLTGCGAKRTGANQASISFSKISLPEPGKVEPFQGCGAPYVLGMISAYNGRDFGSPGWRRVSLDLITNGQISRSFTVVNLWKDERDEVKTLFLLQEPKGLCGTNYMLDEDKVGTSAPDMKVYLFLPSGERQALEIESSRFNEGLLGSDFTYTDLRMQLPTRGYNYRLAGECKLHNEPTWVIEAAPASEEIQQTSSWTRARFYLARNFQLLLGADYFADSKEGNEDEKPIKKMRVVSFEQINNVWTATQINMFTDDAHYSILKMKSARFGVANMDSRLFQINELSVLADNIRQGWTPEELDKRSR